MMKSKSKKKVRMRRWFVPLPVDLPDGRMVAGKSS